MIFLLVTCPLRGQGNKITATIQNGFQGTLDIHLNNNRLIIGMDPTIFGKDMLLAVHDKGYRHVVWKPYGNGIVLEAPRVRSLSGILIPQTPDPDLPHDILGIFPTLDRTGPRAHYIDVSQLFLNNPVVAQTGTDGTMAAAESQLEGARILEHELLVKVRGLFSKDGARYFRTVHFSLMLLPDPMEPRPFDYRMGFFAEDENSFINHFPNHARANIARWRLEKRRKDSTVSSAKFPITFYFGPEVPERWKPYIKAGIMAWAPTFTAAGYRDAIRVRELPPDMEDWQSLQYSMVRWPHKEPVRRFSSDHGSTVKKVTDLRSGEILKADLVIGSSLEDLMDRYFVRCAPMDPRAWEYPFPEDLTGELIQSLVSHEMGHALGIKDAHFGEYAYPFERMRDSTWLQTMGHTPSIMGYARHNHIVQPGDSIPPRLLIQKVGPMDAYQIQWGYGTLNEDGLEDLVRLQDSVPWYRYNLNLFEILGPGSGNEVMDNDDPVASAVLGLKNLKRVLELLPEVDRTQQDNALLERLYRKTLALWHQEMSQVLTMVGGYTVQYKSGIQSGAVYTPIPKTRQMEALDFLVQNVLTDPKWLSCPKFLSRIRYTNKDDVLMGYRLELLESLMGPQRLGRIEQMEHIGDSHDQLLETLLEMLRHGLFWDLGARYGRDFGRWELQRKYLALLMEACRANSGYSAHAQSVFRYERAIVRSLLEKRSERIGDGIEKGHLMLCLESLGSKGRRD
ncbi:zinc-dependent metalloprotease [Flagellimonas sp.]|uniref:zinc-dependent metalloprotease n=1 Tax=Flagellimonas sp. TaxID=2058762 RepID=UPI003BB17ABE